MGKRLTEMSPKKIHRWQIRVLNKHIKILHTTSSGKRKLKQ